MVRRLVSELSARPGVKTPMRGALVVCCACVAAGRTAAQPVTSLMKSARLIAAPEAKERQSYRQKLAHRKGASMSALGHKRTCAVQEAMSALPPIATAKADFGERSCLLSPRKRTCAVQLGMSALGQK